MHQHTLTELYLVFFVGAFFHILKRLAMTKQGRVAFLKTYWLALVVRLFLGAAIFAIWQSNPQLVLKYLPAWLQGAQGGLTNTHLVALLFGYFSDSALDFVTSKVSWLGKEIPPLPNNGGTVLKP